jgi:NADH:ubiquinone oxidoreductase subunit K
MQDDIPPLPPRLPDVTRASGKDFEARELAVLDAEVKAKELKNKEDSQRYLLKWLAVGLAILVILGMSLALYHMAHLATSPAIQYTSPSFAVAMIVAPVASISAITIAVLVGAFRRFDSKDFENTTGVATNTASIFSGQ